MSDQNGQLDGIESALLELQRARDEGVMRPSPVDADHVMASTSPFAGWQLLKLAVPIAAAVIFAVGLGVQMFRSEVDGIRGRQAQILAQQEMDADPCDGSFIQCFTGPRTDVVAQCRTYDYDADGDIDLADFRAFQLACVKPGMTG